MRMSDWSSDVWSADLVGVVAKGHAVDGGQEFRARELQAAPAGDVRGRDRALHAVDRDRMSVVSGQRGSVRVVLVGRRIITKQRDTRDSTYPVHTYSPR